MDLSIIIVNYNTTQYLKICLDSICKFTSGLSFEVIVVDNNSPNREIENIPLIYPQVKFLLRKVNDGFGSGCNYGSTFSSRKYLLFVNPDVFEGDLKYLIIIFI